MDGDGLRAYLFLQLQTDKVRESHADPFKETLGIA
jgi:hypothetical protein